MQVSNKQSANLLFDFAPSRLLDFEKKIPPTFTKDPRVRAKEKNY